MPARRRGQSAREARERFQRERLIEAAEHCLAERGVEGTKMEEVAREAGLSLATIYQQCGGKAGLVAMVHEIRLDELIGQMEAASQGVDEPFEALMVGVRAAVENFMANPSYLRINLRVGHAWGIKEVAPGISSVFEHAWQRTVDRMIPIFEAGIRRGLFYPDDPSIMARIANAHVQIQMARWLEDGERSDLGTTFAAIEEQMRRSFCLEDATVTRCDASRLEADRE